MGASVALVVIAAASLGVHLLAFVALGLLAADSPALRAYRRFVAVVTLWLALLLLTVTGVATTVAAPLAGAVAHSLPVIFLLAGGLPLKPLRAPLSAVIVGTAILLLPFTVTASPLYQPVVEAVWFTAAWGAVAIRVMQALRRQRWEGEHPRRRLVVAGLVIGPLMVGVLVALGAIAAVPLLSSVLQMAVLYAAVRLSIYRVRDDASRTGALAADAARLDRRAVASEIATMVAHEVRNPLSGVRSLAQRLAEDSVDEERRRRYAAIIVREVDRVEKLVGTLLGAASRPPEDTRASVTVVPALLDDLSLLVSAKCRHAGVALEVQSPPLHVAAPGEPLAQILWNLLLNAVAHAPAGSRIRMSARAADGRLVEIGVEDAGPGVPVEMREAIFAPFFSRTGGSGLGLAVVRRIADENGWRVELRDTPGGGATFAVNVPAASAAAGPHGEGATAAVHPRLETHRA